MRYRIVFALAVGFALFTPTTAAAGNRVAGHDHLEGQFAFGVSGGLVEPHGQIGNEPNWTTLPRECGLDLRYGWNGTAYGEFFATSFLAVGLWYGQSDLRMRNRDIVVAAQPRTSGSLVRGRTWLYGARVTGYLPTPRSWTSYATLGVSHSFRKVDLSRDLLLIAPATDVFEVRDDRVGFDGGVGIEQPITRALGVTTSATYYYSGAFRHDVPWMGRELKVHAWEYWSVDIGLLWHPAMRR